MCRFTCGTTLARIAPFIVPGSKPCRCMSWVSQAAYSSAVRLASVRRRNCEDELVAVEHGEFRVGIADINSEQHPPLSPQAAWPAIHPTRSCVGPAAVSSSKAPSRSSPANRPLHQFLAKLNVDLEAERSGLGQPLGAHRLEAVAAPLRRAGPPAPPRASPAPLPRCRRGRRRG